jgi:hypothetical protein
MNAIPTYPFDLILSSMTLTIAGPNLAESKAITCKTLELHTPSISLTFPGGGDFVVNKVSTPEPLCTMPVQEDNKMLGGRVSRQLSPTDCRRPLLQGTPLDSVSVKCFLSVKAEASAVDTNLNRKFRFSVTDQSQFPSRGQSHGGWQSGRQGSESCVQ